MIRRIAAMFLLIFFTFSTITFAFNEDVYYNDIKVGLENMMSNSINVELNGDYISGGVLYKKGTSFVISILNGKVSFNNTLYDNISFTPVDNSSTMRLIVGIKRYNFKGQLDFVVKGDMILPINTINIEEYLNGVVGYEMSNSYPLEALKAQAVAARNYALSQIGRHRSSGYDVCDGTHCQVYRGYNEGYDKVIKAVEETRGVILVYGNSLVNTYYSASNGGYTESSENAWGGRVDYLKSFEDDIDNDSWPYGDRKLTKSEIDMILKSKGYLSLNQSLTDIKISGTFTSGRVKEITIKYIDVDNVEKEKMFSVNDNVRSFFAVTNKNQDIKTKYPEFFNIFNNSVLFSPNFPLMTGKQVNIELKDVYTGFPSALFTFTYDDKTSTYTFSGKGYGHGIGMSQKGAKYRAERGASFEDILKFYYVGTSLKQLNTYVKTFSLTNSYALVGDSIGTNISIVGDSNRLLYKYIVEKSGEKVFTGEYTNSSAFSFSPTSTGEYSINLYVKDIASNREYDDLKTSKLSVYIPPKINKVTVNQQSQYAGKAVVINTGVSGGSSEGIDYKYEVNLNDKVLYTTGYISNSQFTYTPAFEGDYTVNVYIKDRANNKDFDDFSSASFSAKIFVDTSRGGTSGSYINKKLVLKRTLKKGLTGEDVKYLQQALLDLGYNIGASKPTGLFGNGTHNAVVSFQKKNKLPSYGIVASATVDAINKSLSAKYKAPQNPSRGQLLAALRLTYKRTLISGSKGEDVKKLQNTLKFLKYSVDITGVYDKKTYNAVMTFQKKYKIKATGKLDLTTVNKINSLLK